MYKLKTKVFAEQAGEGSPQGGAPAVATTVPGGQSGEGSAPGASNHIDIDSLFNRDPFNGNPDPDPKPVPVPPQVQQIPNPALDANGAVSIPPAIDPATGLPQIPDSGNTITPQAQAVATPPVVSPEMQMMQQQMAAMQQMLLQQQQPAVQTPEQQALAAQQQQAQQLPNMSIPPEIMNALDSEDTTVRTQGIQGLVAQVANHVNMQAQAQIEAVYAAIPDLMQQYMSEQNEAQRIRQDIYGNNPDLDKPELYPLVHAQAEQAMTELGAQQWNENVRNLTVAKVRGILNYAAPAPAGSVAPQQPAQPQIPQYATVPQVPAPVMVQPNQGGGGGTAAAPQSQQNLMEDF